MRYPENSEHDGQAINSHHVAYRSSQSPRMPQHAIPNTQYQAWSTIPPSRSSTQHREPFRFNEQPLRSFELPYQQYGGLPRPREELTKRQVEIKLDYHVHFIRHLTKQLTKLHEFFMREMQYETAQAYKDEAIQTLATDRGTRWEDVAVERLRITYETSNISAGMMAVQTLMDLAEYLQTHQHLSQVQSSYVQPKLEAAEVASEEFWPQYQYMHSSFFEAQRAQLEISQKFYEMQKRAAEEEVELRKQQKPPPSKKKLSGAAMAFQPSGNSSLTLASTIDTPTADNDSGYVTINDNSVSGSYSYRLQSHAINPQPLDQVLETKNDIGQGDDVANPEFYETVQSTRVPSRSSAGFANLSTNRTTRISAETLCSKRTSLDDFDCDICIFLASSNSILVARAMFDTGNTTSFNLISHNFLIENKVMGEIIPDTDNVKELKGPGGESLEVCGYFMLRWRYQRGPNWRQDRFLAVNMTSTQILFCREYIVKHKLLSLTNGSVNIAGAHHKISLTDRQEQNLRKEKQRQDSKEAEAERQADIKRDEEKAKEKARERARGKRRGKVESK